MEFQQTISEFNLLLIFHIFTISPLQQCTKNRMGSIPSSESCIETHRGSDGYSCNCAIQIILYCARNW